MNSNVSFKHISYIRTNIDDLWSQCSKIKHNHTNYDANSLVLLFYSIRNLLTQFYGKIDHICSQWREKLSLDTTLAMLAGKESQT